MSEKRGESIEERTKSSRQFLSSFAYQENIMDISVLILFFNRAETLQKVFDEVRKAQPARLFLYQDGPRSEKDVPGIEACRKIVEKIDWPCEVHKLYQEKNYGCDPSEYIAQKWAFSLTEKCIVLEDDDVPSLSFFRFCQEMLDRYENDDRIAMIAGFNPEEHTEDVSSDYFFTQYFSIWGWASWRRVIDTWEEHYDFLDNPEAVAQLGHLIKEKGLQKHYLDIARRHRETGRAYYETIFCFAALLHSQLAIMPTHNLINNIGLTGDSTHFAASVEALPRGYRRIFTMKRHELTFPLRHPEYIIEHIPFRHRAYKIQGWNSPWIKVGRSLEELCINLRHGNFKHILRSVRNRLSIWFFGRRNK